MKIYTYETTKGLISKKLGDSLRSVFDKAGINYKIKIVAVNSSLKNKLDKWNGARDLNIMLLDELGYDSSGYRVLIATDIGSRFYNWCKEQCGHAEWGCSNSLVSVDYSPEECRLSSQLHECLHFFCVDDCYDEKTLQPKSTCSTSKCVMRYGVVSLDVCSSVLSQIRSNVN